MKESGLVLLQTIPDSIDIDNFKAELLHSFKDIVGVHDLHIWQLTTHKFVSTVHIVFQDPQAFATTIHDVEDYFLRQGISNVTIQPEFFNCSDPAAFNKDICLVACRDLLCKEKYCCTTGEPEASPKTSVIGSNQGTMLSDVSADSTTSKNDLNVRRLSAGDLAIASCSENIELSLKMPNVPKSQKI